jgi:uncharacterized protein (DUF1697 family)
MKLIAFLRGLNVGVRAVSMDYLQTVFEAEGFERPEMFLGSGTVIFDGDTEDIPGLERAIEAMLLEALGFEVTTFIRTDVEVRAIARHKDFMPALIKTAQAHNVVFFREELDAKAREAVMALRSPTDDFHVRGREIYWLSRNKPADSVISHGLFELTVGRPSTVRGMNALRQLVKKYGPR